MLFDKITGRVSSSLMANRTACWHVVYIQNHNVSVLRKITEIGFRFGYLEYAGESPRDVTFHIYAEIGFRFGYLEYAGESPRDVTFHIYAEIAFRFGYLEHARESPRDVYRELLAF